MKKTDIAAFFDNCAPWWDADMVRNEDIIATILDNGGILGDASMQMTDGAYVGPTSTAVGASILQAIACRVKEISLEEGWEAEYFKSSNVDGGDEYNQKLLDKYKDQIPGLA